MCVVSFHDPKPNPKPPHAAALTHATGIILHDFTDRSATRFVRYLYPSSEIWLKLLQIPAHRAEYNFYYQQM